MKRENRAPLILLVVVAVLAVSVGGYILFSPYVGAASLPVPAGTTFTSNDTGTWFAHFTVGPTGGRLVGAWTVYDGAGPVGLAVVNGTVTRPVPPPGLYSCPLMMPFSQANGNVSEVLAPGPYTVYWNTFCAYAAKIVVTQTIRVIPT